MSAETRGVRNIFSGTGYSSEERTVHSEITESRTSCPLDLCIVTAEQKKNGVERVAADWSDLLLCDFCESKGSATLEIDIVGK